MTRIVLATNNKGKLRELKEIFDLCEILSLNDVGISIEVDEDQDTFYGNALKKARVIWVEVNKHSSPDEYIPVIADDSGICVDYFNDWPGVYTARFAGENATDDQRNSAILEKMTNLTGRARNAKVICDLVYYNGGEPIVGKGILHGTITKKPRGENGFGFDPIFELKSSKKTLAELSAKEKNEQSARYLAAKQLYNRLLINKLV